MFFFYCGFPFFSAGMGILAFPQLNACQAQLLNTDFLLVW
jgi:hypothetical protein